MIKFQNRGMYRTVMFEYSYTPSIYRLTQSCIQRDACFFIYLKYFISFFTRAGKMPGFPETSQNIGCGKSAIAPPLYLNKMEILRHNREDLVGLTGRSNTAPGILIHDKVSLQMDWKTVSTKYSKNWHIICLIIHWLVRLLGHRRTHFGGIYIHNLHTHTQRHSHLKISHTVLQVPQWLQCISYLKQKKKKLLSYDVYKLDNWSTCQVQLVQNKQHKTK